MKFTLALLSFFFIFHAKASYIGTEFQLLNPTTFTSNFISHSSSEVLKKNKISIGYWANYSNLSFSEIPGAGFSLNNFNSSQLAGDLNFSYGLSNNLELSLQLPHTLFTTVNTNTTSTTSFQANGLDEARLQAKYRFLNSEKTNAFLSILGNQNLIQQNFFRGENEKQDIIGTIGIDGDLSIPIKYGANVGYRLRNAGTQYAGVTIEPVDSDAFMASLALSYNFGTIKLIAEAFGHDYLKSTVGYEKAYAEGTLGIKKMFSENLYLDAGAGRSFIGRGKSVDYRLFAGLHWKGKMHTKPTQPELLPETQEALQEPIEDILAEESYITDLDEPTEQDGLIDLPEDIEPLVTPTEVAQELPKKTLQTPSIIEPEIKIPVIQETTIADTYTPNKFEDISNHINSNKEPFVIFYDLAMSHIRPDQKRKIRKLIKYLKDNNDKIEAIKFLGSTCDLGPDKVNLNLKEGRAGNLVNYLKQYRKVPDIITNKITIDRIAGDGIYPNTSEENRQLNRSTIIRIKWK